MSNSIDPKPVPHCFTLSFHTVYGLLVCYEYIRQIPFQESFSMTGLLNDHLSFCFHLIRNETENHFVLQKVFLDKKLILIDNVIHGFVARMYVAHLGEGEVAFEF